MHVAVTGAAGMIGRKLVARLVGDGRLGDAELERLTLVDVVAPEPAAGRGEAWAGDLRRARRGAQRLVDGRPDVIVHLAAVVSGEAEADFDKGYRVNLDGTRALLEAIRRTPTATARGWCSPRRSRCSARRCPTPIPEDFAALPLTSYGTQKAIDELLLADYTPARLRRRHRHPAADHLHPARGAEQGRVGVLLEHPARAAGRPGGGAAGARDRAALARLARARRSGSCCARRRSTPS